MSVDQALKTAKLPLSARLKKPVAQKNDSGDRTKRENPQVRHEALYMTDLPTVLENRLVLRLGNNPALGQPEMAHRARPR